MDIPNPNINMEHVVPIVINHITLQTPLGIMEKHNQRYHNVTVTDLDRIKYVQNQQRPYNYIRNQPVTRYYDENVCWPDHPLNINGKIQGAIAIIQSRDGKILLVRNRKLWGLPKGARNYYDFTNFKKLTDKHYRETGEIMEHEEASFTEGTIETSIENVCREVQEETGIVIDTKLLELFTCRNHTSTYCAYDGYFYPYPSDANELLNDLVKNGTDHENDELLWVTDVELRHMLKNHRQSSRPKVFNHITYSFLEDFIRR